MEWLILIIGIFALQNASFLKDVVGTIKPVDVTQKTEINQNNLQNQVIPPRFEIVNQKGIWTFTPVQKTNEESKQQNPSTSKFITLPGGFKIEKGI